jgi:hypothetical protein
MFVWPATGKTRFANGGEEIEVRVEQRRKEWIPVKALECATVEWIPELDGTWQFVGIPAPTFVIGNVKYPEGSMVRHKKTKRIYVIEQDPSSGLTCEHNLQPCYVYRLAGTLEGRAHLWIRIRSEMEDGRFTKHTPKVSK